MKKIEFNLELGLVAIVAAFVILSFEDQISCSLGIENACSMLEQKYAARLK